MPCCINPLTNSWVYVQTPPTVSAVINTCIPDPRLPPDANLECRCNLSREIVQCSNDAPAPMLDHPADRTSVCRVVCPGMGTSARVRSPKPRASSDRPARRGFQCDCRDRLGSDSPAPMGYALWHRSIIERAFRLTCG